MKYDKNETQMTKTTKQKLEGVMTLPKNRLHLKIA